MNLLFDLNGLYWRENEKEQSGLRGKRVYICSFSHACSACFGTAPTLVAVSWPFLNNIRVGMLRMPYLLGVIGFSSRFILAIVSCPCISVASSSSMGPIILHGPHHSAQKSTRTGLDAFKTSVSKLVSVTAVVAA